MSEWTPIDKQDLISMVNQELESTPAGLKSFYLTIRTPITNIACDRRQESGVEYLYKLADYSDYSLIYDDVEDEYGLLKNWSQCPVVNTWELIGGLSDTLYELRKRK